jgi:hypothetical protein
MWVKLFVVFTILSGFCAAAGSILGHAAGDKGLWVGGIVGGLVGALGAAAIARWRRWITPHQFWGTALGGMLGFVAAALVAVNTLSSATGPILSTLLIGTGALLGTRLQRSA